MHAYGIILSVRAAQVVLVVKNPLANAGDIRDKGSILGLGRYPVEGNVWRIFLSGEFHGSTMN